MTINLFFLHKSGQLNELYTTDGANWHDGTLNTQQQIFPKSSSKLAATWADNHHGNDLPSLLLVYQDDDNHFRLYNSTGDTWVPSIIPGHPIAASGVSLSTMFVGNFPDQLRLYYQVASGNLVVADWLSFTQFDCTCTVASILPYLRPCIVGFTDLLASRQDQFYTSVREVVRLES